MGRSSAGKSSLFRAIKGLWSLREGRVTTTIPIGKSVFFLPQKPFFTDGSLRQQIVYPLEVVTSEVTSDENDSLRSLLEELGLSDLIRRCGGSLDSDPRWNWYDVLSPGEMQRLAFIRLFFHRPTVAFLDEATSALSSDIEALLYQKCVDLGIGLVSVGHRESLKRWHNKILTIGLEDGGWRIEDLE